MAKLAAMLVLFVLLSGCVTLPPPDPISAEEIVHLGQVGPGNPALIDALETRPLGFPVTFDGLKDLENRGVSSDVIDTIVAYSVERRARALAPRYDPYRYDPYYPWPFRWHFGIGYHHHCR